MLIAGTKELSQDVELLFTSGLDSTFSEVKTLLEILFITPMTTAEAE